MIPLTRVSGNGEEICMSDQGAEEIVINVSYEPTDPCCYDVSDDSDVSDDDEVYTEKENYNIEDVIKNMWETPYITVEDEDGINSLEWGKIYFEDEDK